MTEVAKTNEPTLSVEQLQGMLKTMQPNKAVSLSSEMLTMDPGDEVRSIFTGMCTVSKFNTTTGELVDAVELLTEDGMKKSADKVLVSTLRDKTAPMAILIVCTGWNEKGKAGRYREFEIYPLEPGNGKAESGKKK